TDSSHAVNVGSIVTSYLEYYSVSGTNNLSFNTGFAFGQYAEGMTFLIRSGAANTDSVTININGLGAKKLLNPVGKKLKAKDLMPGMVHRIIYRGNDFTLDNGDNGCPNNFVEVNENYCIEITEHSATAVTYFAATKACYDINARICTWNEWYNACQKSGLGLVNMNNNWEFIDDAHDHGSFVGMVGVGGCTGFSSLDSHTALRTIRCCYRK
ncbi:MAG TPA: hypothetical protein VM187_07140, partial [Niastella sp.]|nr:hypothetical protein [Niastella sp.]